MDAPLAYRYVAFICLLKLVWLDICILHPKNDSEQTLESVVPLGKKNWPLFFTSIPHCKKQFNFDHFGVYNAYLQPQTLLGDKCT